MQFALYRLIYFKLHKKDKGWPDWIPHTDEERIQTCAKMLINRPNSEWYITEKLDGQSGTFFIGFKKIWGIDKLDFGVCSRNIRLSKPDNSSYWTMAKKYDIGKKLLNFNKSGIVIQGECIGPRIQKNKYGLNEQDFFVFNIIDNGIKYNFNQMKVFCELNGLKCVPIIDENWIFNNCNRSVPEIIKELINLSTGKSSLNKDVWREGIVVRLKDNPNVSFKVINPEFSLKYLE
jgi:RNA ligase (TIGR02306 family)